MFAKMKIAWGMLIVLSLILAGCRPSPAATTAAPTADPNAVLTAAAQTASVRLTQAAASTPTAPAASPTNTLAPVTGPTVAAGTTAAAGTTPAATAMATAAATTAAAPPPAANRPDHMTFVADVTVPDGTNFNPGESFTKTWRVQNSGTTTWTTAYSLVFSSGAQMGAPASVSVPSEVAPGGTVDISVNMTAPQDAGKYTGYWMMRNAAGQTFGLGPNADGAIYVDITVGGGGNAANTPAATTSSSSSGIVSGVTILGDETFRGACPYSFTFTGQFVLSKASSVTYELQAFEMDNTPIQVSPARQTAQFGAGTQNVTFTLTFNDNASGYIVFLVTSPVQVRSDPLDFDLRCT